MHKVLIYTNGHIEMNQDDILKNLKNFMRNKKLIILFILIISNIFAQKVDTIINVGIYKSYFNISMKQCFYVTYTLSKGGGDCDRDKFRFKNDTKLKTATNKDYKGSGYDMGHMANAEDFAFDCILDEKTFRFYNCLPQTPNLNRGSWHKWENTIRDESQKDSLYILCGGRFTNKSKKIGSIFVPNNCWKVVQHINTKEIIHILYFSNIENNNTVLEFTEIRQLEALLGNKILII